MCLTELNIRQLTAADTPQVVSFYALLPESVTSLYLPFSDPNEAVIHQHLEQSDAGKHISLGIIDENGIVLGHCFILLIKEDKPIFGIGLSPDIHGKGWGRKIAQYILDRSDNLGLPLVTLTVVKRNEKARKLYETLGFTITGECTFREQADSWEMERPRPEH